MATKSSSFLLIFHKFSTATLSDVTKCLDFHGFAGPLTPPSRKAKNTNRYFLRSARAAVGAAGTEAGGRSAKLDNNKRNSGRATVAGVKLQVQNFPTRPEIHENEQENDQNDGILYCFGTVPYPAR